MDNMTEECRRLFQYLRLKDHERESFRLGWESESPTQRDAFFNAIVEKIDGWDYGSRIHDGDLSRRIARCFNVLGLLGNNLSEQEEETLKRMLGYDERLGDPEFKRTRDCVELIEVKAVSKEELYLRFNDGSAGVLNIIATGMAEHRDIYDYSYDDYWDEDSCSTERRCQEAYSHTVFATDGAWIWKDHRWLDTDLGIIEFDMLWNRLNFGGSGVDTVPPGGIINMETV